MAFCGKCGANINEGVKFCSGCGAATDNFQTQNQQTQQATINQNSFTSQLAGLNNTQDTTSEFDMQDITNNKLMAVLSYFGPLVLVPILAAKESKFAKFHANQGLTLLITNVVYGVLDIILSIILNVIFPWNWSYGYYGGRGAVYGIITAILGFVWVAFAVLAVIGIINAATGKAKALPVIGKIKILK